uniref:Bm13457 n=1 Tax=Brugia malayi TaxID=6279 RepID=A0A1I9G2A1_BRUMA|nr:Bm13457 [Brugia malayi]
MQKMKLFSCRYYSFGKNFNLSKKKNPHNQIFNPCN